MPNILRQNLNSLLPYWRFSLERYKSHGSGKFWLRCWTFWLMIEICTSFWN